MGRKAKKGSSRYYFTMDTEKAIIRYNNAPDKPRLRNTIYNEHIRKSFEKLVFCMTKLMAACKALDQDLLRIKYKLEIETRHMDWSRMGQ